MPRNRSEKVPAHAVELIAFARLCKKRDYMSATDTPFEVRNLFVAHDKLPFKAREDLAHLSVWKDMATHIFETYGDGEGPPVT